eukprot:TRINITY_DN4086_c0_g1_i2.p1 TRINITY_DN4086_c0_g1~~TRINITY_DN4086_c0_g1_i2.p1  ORF type:complete len:487 (+),score=137.71 TRINITY_DN4086_c0_g1_i2:734-2194(+)
MIDMWSVGVISYCILGGYPPFSKTSSTPIEMQIASAMYEFHDEEWAEVGPTARDFISKLLVVDPKKRMTSRKALTHPFIHQRQSLSSMHMSRNFERLKSYNSKRKFKATALAVLSTEILKGLTIVEKHETDTASTTNATSTHTMASPSTTTTSEQQLNNTSPRRQSQDLRKSGGNSKGSNTLTISANSRHIRSKSTGSSSPSSTSLPSSSSPSTTSTTTSSLKSTTSYTTLNYVPSTPNPEKNEVSIQVPQIPEQTDHVKPNESSSYLQSSTPYEMKKTFSYFNNVFSSLDEDIKFKFFVNDLEDMKAMKGIIKSINENWENTTWELNNIKQLVSSGKLPTPVSSYSEQNGLFQIPSYSFVFTNYHTIDTTGFQNKLKHIYEQHDVNNKKKTILVANLLMTMFGSLLNIISKSEELINYIHQWLFNITNNLSDDNNTTLTQYHSNIMNDTLKRLSHLEETNEIIRILIQRHRLECQQKISSVTPRN